MTMLFKKSVAILLTLCLCWPGGLAFAAKADAGAGTGPFVLSGLEAAQDQLRLELNGQAQYEIKTLSNPPRFIVDILNTRYEVGTQTAPATGKYFRGVRGSQHETAAGPMSRVVVDLAEDGVPYRAFREGNVLILSMGPKESVPAEQAAAASDSKKAAAVKPVEAGAAKASEPSAAKASGTSTAKPAETAAKSSRPKVKVARPVAAPEPELASNPEVPPPDAAIPASEPASAAKPAAASPLLSWGGPASSLPSKAGAKCRPKGTDIMSRLPCDPVVLNLNNTNIKEVLTIFANKAGINIISGPDVTGTLSLQLKGVPFDEAFRTILNMLGLTTSQVGDNVLRVLTPGALQKERVDATGVTKMFSLKFAKAGDIMGTVTSVRTAEGRTKGSALVDEKTNTLIVTDTVEGLVSTERLIAALDAVPKQVLIEAKIVEISLGHDFNFGVKWDFYQTSTGKFLGDEGYSVIGSPLKNTSDLKSANPFTPHRLNAEPVNQPQGGSGTGVALPFPGWGSLSVGRVTNNYFLNLSLAAGISQSKAKILSDPKIATLNNKRALINVIKKVPYDSSSTSATGAVTRGVSYTDIGITLEVTPIISSDESRITLDIKPKVSKPGDLAGAGGTIAGAPVTDQSNVETTVIVKDGETIVIGGLITDTNQNAIAKVPLLGDIPLLGWLFKRKVVKRSRQELLIFVTPRIIKDV